ncbi:hypothetical protein J7E24_07315 [Hymenobacter sp. ISL-91]|uniref:hypothetical protein n=1 Tax=Hymenobacter sp. ISL-91 TaxID=2819151 RepID=UPI001BE578CD|nr:hypothetical protein [Hymenobacter sp. ISL-91]MBT2557587.1 hypothetical protein [Hymenobacter sp. ISL-91]
MPEYLVPETPASVRFPAAATPPGQPAPAGRRWGRWLLAAVALLLPLLLFGPQYLDQWLHKELEQQVANQTQGQYRLQVGELRTSLWQRSIWLRQVRLRPTAGQLADSLPRVHLDVARLRVQGVGLLALLRRGVVPIDSLVLDSAQLKVLALASKPAKTGSAPLHERLPLRLKGLRIAYLGLLSTQVVYRPGPDSARIERADLTGQHLLISAAGAADTQRLGYAAAWSLQLQRARGQAAGHRVRVAAAHLSTTRRLLQLDSLRIEPQRPYQPAHTQVDFALARLRLSGFDLAALQQRRRFRADSLHLQSPRLAARLMAQATAPGLGSAPAYLRQLHLAHLQIEQGAVEVTGADGYLKIHQLALLGAGLQYTPAVASDSARAFSAESWDVRLGPTQAAAAAHTLRLTSAQLSTRTRALTLHSVLIRPPAPGQGPPGAVRVSLTLPRLALRGLDANALQQRLLRADSLTLSNPRLHFTPPAQPPPPVWKLLSGVVRRSELGRFVVQNADIQFGGLRHAPTISGLFLTGSAIRIDSLAARMPARIAYARSWQARSGRITVPFDLPYYQAASQTMYLDTDARTLVFNTMSLTPKYSAAGMNRHKGYQAPAVSIRVRSLRAEGLDFAALVSRSDFRAARLTAQSPVVRIVSDGRGPINPNYSKVSPEQMRELPVLVDVRQLIIRNGNLYSSYRSPLTPIVGRLSINRFNGRFFNLSNDPGRQTAATPLTGRATTYLQNRCRLDAQVSMYLLDPQGRHRVWGAFGPGSFSLLNPMTVPTRLVRFKSGELRSLRFAMRADRRGVRGTTWASYSGLQLTLLNYGEEEIEKSLFSRIKSKLVNVVVIRDQNPRKRGKFETGQMTSTREPRFSMFTLWRQGIVSGLFHNVGVPQKLAQKLSESKDEAPLPR